ncbi:alpha-(1,3)-fucosyltransferase C-like [Neodiprion pinetum]|uniref:alpha-(1,3)-fucosyltransferase C-like n=1 Tax=Neodiprion pinetum TaxID=441929 RepID=UPI00371B68BC
MSVLYEKVFPVCYIPLKILLKICLTATIAALLLLPCVFFLDARTPLMLRKNKENASLGERKLKTVLYWTKMFGNKSFYFGEGDVFRDCPISACRATHDRKSLRVQDFDAVLFHGIQTNASDLPPVRSQCQKYIFVLMEPPANWGLDAAFIPDQFYNWTMTYRRDSDIPRPYGYVIHSATNTPLYPFGTGTLHDLADNVVIYGNLPSTKNHTYRLEGKRVAAAWFVSHCRTASSRERYASELRRYVEVDIFGRCGDRRCPMNNVKCYDMLEARYYFYLAFENSLCQDYVTEKLYKVMNYDVVPVVYGAANYTEFAPPGSYINVADFEGPAHLAKHLRYLMNNPQEYAKYFWWKEHFFIDLSHRVTLCNMCAMLHDEKSLAVSVISGLKKWWSRKRCQDPVEFFKNTTLPRQ